MSETDWPQPGDKAVVKCSDNEYRPATCEAGPHGLVWTFPSGGSRYVTSSLATPLWAHPIDEEGTL